MKPYGFHREAEAEYVSAAQEYAAVSPELGARFYDEMERLIADVRRWPGMYRFIRKPIQRHFSTTFPYGLLYEDRPDMVRFLAVMPLHRDPGYWIHRL